MFTKRDAELTFGRVEWPTMKELVRSATRHARWNRETAYVVDTNGHCQVVQTAESLEDVRRAYGPENVRVIREIQPR